MKIFFSKFQTDFNGKLIQKKIIEVSMELTVS